MKPAHRIGLFVAQCFVAMGGVSSSLATAAAWTAVLGGDEKLWPKGAFQMIGFPSAAVVCCVVLIRIKRTLRLDREEADRTQSDAIRERAYEHWRQTLETRRGHA